MKRDRACLAEREAMAQLEIIRALKPLSGARRERVMIALGHLLMAEERVPGILGILRIPEAKPQHE